MTDPREPIPLGPPPVDGDRGGAGDLKRAKRRLRREIRRRLADMTAEERFRASERVAERIRSLEEWRKARTVLFYAALPDEVDLAHLMDEALTSGREVLLPVCEPATKSIRLVAVHDPVRDLREGTYGILEPREGLPLEEPGELDLALVPGRAFDKTCARLGRGAGYYDRFLSRLPPRRLEGPFKLGVCFARQVVETVPVGPRDVRVDAVVSEDEALRASRSTGSRRRAP